MKKKNLINIIKNSKSKYEILINFWGYTNSRIYQYLEKFILENGVDVSHLEKKEKENKNCLQCGKIIIKYGKKFCSRSCSISYNNIKRKLTLKTKKKISQSLKKFNSNKITNSNASGITTRICEICGKIFNIKRTKSNHLSRKKCCSDICSKKLRSIKAKISINKIIKDGKHKGWIKRNITSYPEKFFINVLNNNNIKYRHNYPVQKKELGLNSTYSYFLDFFIENKKIDLEIDGKQHERRKKNDKYRDKLLKKNGYVVYRIRWKNINTENGKNYIKNEIKKFLDFYNSI